MGEAVQRSGGKLVVDSLVAQGVRRITCVPGESFLPVLDALIDSGVDVVSCRHEAGAANMALAEAKLTGHTGVAAVSRGPGAMHAAIAVHTSEQDAVPLILLIGQVALRDRGRGGFQEIDFSQVFGKIAKWVTSLDTVERIPETIARAVRVAEGGRPGPVVIEMPEDILAEAAQVLDVPCISAERAGASTSQVERFGELLHNAERPLLILGRGRWSDEAASLAEAFAQRFGTPVLAGFRCQDYIDNDSEYYAGHLGFNIDKRLRQRLDESDLIVSLGGHFGDVETQGYEIFRPKEGQTIVHVASSEFDADRYVQASLLIRATSLEFLQAVMQGVQPVTSQSRWVESLRGDETARSAVPSAGDDQLGRIVAWLNAHVSAETVVANGAGNYAIWVHRFFKYRRFGTQLAPASGAMGFGLPAGIAAAIADPARPVIVFAGDGCFTMALPELSLLVGSTANIKIVVVNNGVYGTIKMHQERAFPGRPIATSLMNPDFVALAEAYGIAGARVSTVEEFAASYCATSGPALIEVIVDPEQLTPSSFGQTN